MKKVKKTLALSIVFVHTQIVVLQSPELKFKANIARNATVELH